MKISEVKEYCKSFRGVIGVVEGDPSNILVYKVGDKKFAYFKTSEPEKWRFSIRVSSSRFLELTDQTGIKPARYMHRFHWITIVQTSSVDSSYLKELIQWSYNKALTTLSKKAQKEIME